MTATDPCGVESCDEVGRGGKGFCKKHYARLVRTGDPEGLRYRASPDGTCLECGFELSGRRISYCSDPCAKRNKARQYATPEVMAASVERRRIRRSEEWFFVLEFYESKCVKCREASAMLTIDHVMPSSLGGEDSIKNLQPLCRRCNSSKGATCADYRWDEGLKMYDEWIKRTVDCG